MTSRNTSQVATAFSISIGIYFIAVVLPKYIISGAASIVMTTQALELCLSLLAIFLVGKRKFSEYGFCLPKGDQSSPTGKFRWVLISAGAPLLGIIASLCIVGLGGGGNPVVKQLTFPQIILFVWIFSSIIEEVFTRGFLQGHLSVLSGRYVSCGVIRIELPVLISALFFACMHLVLPFVGADATTTVIVFLFTLSIGLMAGYLRAKTGSLVPAIAVHMLANIGGAIGGVLSILIRTLLHGKPPGI